MAFGIFGRGKKDKDKGNAVIPTVQNREPNAFGYYKMICPFCLEEFDVWEMPFRAHAEQLGRANAGQSAPMGGRGLDRNAYGRPERRAPEPQQEAANAAELHAFPLEIDEKHREFVRRLHINRAYNPNKGKVLSLFVPDSEGGGFDGQGIAAARLFGSNEWIPVSGSSASVGALRNKAVAAIRDQYGNITEERLCPHCHNPMPTRAGQLPSYVIMILGDTNSGKTVYKIRMLHELNEKGLLNRTISAGSFYTRNATDGEDAPSISELWRSTFRKAYSGQQKQIVPATQVGYIDPYTVTLLRNNEEVALLTFYDFPGEAIRFSRSDPNQSEYVQTIRQRMEKVDGLMFLLDTSTAEFMQYNLPNNYKATSEERKNQEVWYPREVLDHFLTNYLTVDMGAFVDVPICYMFSKADLLEMAINDCREGKDPWVDVGEIAEAVSQLEDPAVCVTNWKDTQRARLARTVSTAAELNSVMRTHEAKHNQVDLDNIFQSDRELNALLYNEVAGAMNRSAQGMSFAVSAVGAPISSEDDHVEQAPAIRIMEPLEYLLWQMGLVECMEPENEENLQRAIKLRTRN